MITDSGLGGLSVCAAIERRLRGCGDTRLTYVNAWPFEDRGYNDLPTLAERAEAFDRVLSRLALLVPDRILIACNTLSILYPHTDFSREAAVPVHGIINVGVGLFAKAMAAHPASPLLLLGTRTTIESGTHREALLRRGIDPRRLFPVACHGLAKAIEKDPDSALVGELIAACARDAKEAAPEGAPVLVGLCCTHYAYLRGELCGALQEALARPVQILDPNVCMAIAMVPEAYAVSEEDGLGPAVDILSKVKLDELSRRSIARLIEPVSPATAQALLNYQHRPELF